MKDFLFDAKKINFLIICVLTFFLCSCASAPKVENIGETIRATFEPVDTTPVAIAVPEEIKDKPRTYFSYVDSKIMEDVEIGSPASLRRAASLLRQSNSIYEENDKVLLAIETSIMQMVYPSERVEWGDVSISSENAYIGAINSAKNGIYDTSTGNEDFLSILLPSLVILNVNDVSSFFSNSEAALKKSLELRNNSVLANYLLGELYKKSGNKSEALRYFKEASLLAPECFQTSYTYMECLKDTGYLAEAKEIVEPLLEKYPTNTSLLKSCAHIFYETGDYDKAEQYVSRALQQDPNDLPMVLFRAQILMEKKDYIHAASLLDVYSRQDNSSKQYLLLRASLQFDWSKNIHAAINTVESAFKLYPEAEDVLLLAARISSFSGLTVAGKNVNFYAREVLKEDPANEIALQYAVEGFMQEKNWQEAYKLNKNLMSSKKVSRKVQFNHIKICIALKKYDEAWNDVSGMYKANPDDEEIVEHYVLVMVESGKSVQALSVINQQLSSASSKLKSFLYYQRSFLQNTEETVLSDLRSSLMSNPKNSESLFRLYKIYFNKKEYRKSQYYLKQVVALSPSNADYRNLLEELNSLIK